MNKFYIQIVFFLLSIFIYVNNKTLATELAPEENTKTKEETKEETKTKPKRRYPTPEEIYEKNKQLLCTDPKEIENAVELMNEAIMHLAYHATSKDDYELCESNLSYNNTFSKKKHGDTVVQRISFIYYDPKKYNEIINLLWNPSFANRFNNGFVKRKIDRVYNPNLVIIQQRYKNSIFDRWKYFYALAAKVDISEKKTIIVMTSANINDGYPSEKEYKNTIIESANLFKIDIDSSESIRSGKFEKTFLNIAGFLIEKKEWNIDITYLESIDGHTSNFKKLIIRKALVNSFH
ncbi:fam-a protein [Plasmodium vinckei vinckei]|uniref:Fam-a protein n=1 Tax=Plasmodium vinckei vinckei TaxID=54757 RepID=A0A449BZN0_PLAVN|nr:fam-a protein [Plasmodium vinckei vinckei]VEV58769.1 fam-a protein [Plasmodium vinckei vinckei]